jgi:TolA-binding protein
MRITLPVLTLAAIIALPASGLAQNRVDQQMFAELRMLQEQVQQLRLAVNSLADSVKVVNTRQDEQAVATRKGFADQKVLTDAITDSIRILREKGDDTNVRIATLTHELESMRQSMQALQTSVVTAMANVAAQQAAAAPTTDPAAAGAAGGATPPTAPLTPPPMQSPQLLYDNAWSDYMAARYDLAIQGFQAYLRSFPSNPDAYRAQFNIGESHYNAGRYREAVQAYTETVTNYKKSLWEDSAYYKRALAYEQLGMKDQAKADYQYVMKNFPDSTFAPLSKAALDRIK